VEIEKLMYKMNSLLVSEQMVEDSKKTKDDRVLLQSREYFNKILVSYLQLPHILKSIFDKMKIYEGIISKFFANDGSLLKDLGIEVIRQFKAKVDILNQKLASQEQQMAEQGRTIK